MKINSYYLTGNLEGKKMKIPAVKQE